MRQREGERQAGPKYRSRLNYPRCIKSLRNSLHLTHTHTHTHTLTTSIYTHTPTYTPHTHTHTHTDTHTHAQLVYPSFFRGEISVVSCDSILCRLMASQRLLSLRIVKIKSFLFRGKFYNSYFHVNDITILYRNK